MITIINDHNVFQLLFIIVSFLYLIFTIIRFYSLLKNTFSSIHFSAFPNISINYPSVSLLIPCRNEEKTLPILFNCINSLSYPNLNIKFLNDHSEDQTENLLVEFCKNNQNATYINGKKLPETWLGKSFACYQLAQESFSEYFLFIDADVQLGGSILEVAIQKAIQDDTDLLSCFPKQIVKSFGEKTIIPFMFHLLIPLLPFNWIKTKSDANYSAANGQFMLFKASTYKQHQWHEKVKREITEDISIARKVKESKLRVALFIGDERLQCRMYSSFLECIHGFSKNIVAGFHGNPLFLFVYIAMSILSPFVISVVNPSHLMVILILEGLISGWVALLSKNNILESVLLTIPRIFFSLLISLLGIWKHYNGKIYWKGRNIHISKQ